MIKGENIVKNIIQPTSYICNLPMTIQVDIEAKLIECGMKGPELERAMSGRLCDLEDTINIKPILMPSNN